MSEISTKHIKITVNSVEDFANISEAIKKLPKQTVSDIEHAELHPFNGIKVRMKKCSQHDKSKRTYLPKGSNHMEIQGGLLRCFLPGYIIERQYESSEPETRNIEVEFVNAPTSKANEIVSIMDENRGEILTSVVIDKIKTLLNH